MYEHLLVIAVIIIVLTAAAFIRFAARRLDSQRVRLVIIEKGEQNGGVRWPTANDDKDGTWIPEDHSRFPYN